MTKKLKEENKRLRETSNEINKAYLEESVDNNRLRRKLIKAQTNVIIGCYITFLAALILLAIATGISSERYDYIQYEPVLNNVGSHICEVHGSERFIDWEDNVLECSDGMIDFNKPVILP